MSLTLSPALSGLLQLGFNRKLWLAKPLTDLDLGDLAKSIFKVCRCHGICWHSCFNYRQTLVCHETRRHFGCSPKPERITGANMLFPILVNLTSNIYPGFLEAFIFLLQQ